MEFDAIPDLLNVANLGLRQNGMPPRPWRNEEKYLYFYLLLPLSICSTQKEENASKDCFRPFLQKTNPACNAGTLVA